MYDLHQIKKALRDNGSPAMAQSVHDAISFIELVADTVAGGGRTVTFDDADIATMDDLLGREQ